MQTVYRSHGLAFRFRVHSTYHPLSSLHLRRCSKRFFHPSGKLHSSLLNTCCIQTYDVLAGLHASTGLPWLLTLPLTALIVRSTFVLPLAIWSRINLQRTASIRPLLLAWQPIIMNRVVKENVRLGPDTCRKLAELNMKEKRTELFQTFGVTRWSAFAPLLQLPVFLLVVETIRRMCGQKSGLLGFIAEKIGANSGHTASIPVEGSMAAEGGLWFPDLLVPDPMLILPATLSALLYANASEFSSISERTGITPSKGQVRWSRALKVLALAMFPFTLNIPSGLLIYWVSSALFGTATNLLLRAAMPLPTSPAPCTPLIKPYMKDITS